jgi:hypothetical protein
MGTFHTAVFARRGVGVCYPVADLEGEVCFLVRLKPAFDNRGSHHAMPRPVVLCGAFERNLQGRERKEGRSDAVRGERSHVSTRVVCWYASATLDLTVKVSGPGDPASHPLV